MNTGRVTISLLLAVLVLASGCATHEPRAILSAAELNAMIHVEMTLLDPALPTAAIAANDQP